MIRNELTLPLLTPEQHSAINAALDLADSSDVFAAIIKKMPPALANSAKALSNHTLHALLVLIEKLEKPDQDSLSRAICSVLYRQVNDIIRGIPKSGRRSDYMSGFVLAFLHVLQRYVPIAVKENSAHPLPGLALRLKCLGVSSNKELWRFLESEPQYHYASFTLGYAKCHDLLGWFLQTINLPDNAIAPRECEKVESQVDCDAFALLGVLHEVNKEPCHAAGLSRVTIARNAMRLLIALPQHARAGWFHLIQSKSAKLRQWWSAIMPQGEWVDLREKSSVYFVGSALFSRSLAEEFYALLLDYFAQCAGQAVNRQRSNALEHVFQAHEGVDLPWGEEQCVDQVLFAEMKWQALEQGWPTDRICLLDSIYYCAEKRQQSVENGEIGAVLLKSNAVFSEYQDKVNAVLSGEIPLNSADFSLLFRLSCQNERQAVQWATLFNKTQKQWVFLPLYMSNAFWLLPASPHQFNAQGRNVVWREVMRCWQTPAWKEPDRIGHMVERILCFFDGSAVKRSVASRLNVTAAT